MLSSFIEIFKFYIKFLIFRIQVENKNEGIIS
jgi:hypothetical protein